MPNKKAIFFKFFFIALVVVDISIGSFGADIYRIGTKPLILLSLLIYFIVVGKFLEKRIYFAMILALTCSLLGDIFLLFDSYTELFFILGLGAFLVAHLIYGAVFLKKWYHNTPPYFYRIIFFLSLYGILLFLYIKPALGALAFPVTLYIAAILFMAITASKSLKTTTALRYSSVFIGALFFVLSDSILAIDLFKHQLPFATLLIMGSYATAQYVIVFGILGQRLNSENLSTFP